MLELPPIFIITGPPGAGKSTLALALLEAFEFGYHIEVDVVRLWVKVGRSDVFPWTEETERQFQIAEAASMDMAKRYQDAGFAVAIDHCRNIARLEEVIQEHAPDRRIVKICLLPDLTINQARNAARTNKDFDPGVLVEVIEYINNEMRAARSIEGWLTIDNTCHSPAETKSMILGQTQD